MINLAPRHLTLVKEILRKHFPGREVRVFGSRATSKAKAYSDLDLVIMGAEKLARRKVHALQDSFEESDLPIRVEVLDWNTISDVFRSVIEKNYKILQSAGPKTVAK